MKLELKHLAPYLPYKLKFINEHGQIRIMDGLFNYCAIHFSETNRADYFNYYPSVKPILRPLSDIIDTAIIEHDLGGQNSDAIREWYDYFESDALNRQTAALCAPYPVIEWLFKYNFDVFGLIEQGLGIDINTIQP